MKTEPFDFIVRRARREDLEAMVDLGASFFGESNRLGGATMSRKNYRASLEPYFDHPLVAAFLAERDGQLIGNAYIYAQNDATEEYIGDLYQFYILPEYRGTGVSRALADLADKQYADWKCKSGYLEAAHGMKGERHLKLFENLWGRLGFKKIGIVMMKEY
jgi:GNAT superfamily N-acetyltransferase